MLTSFHSFSRLYRLIVFIAVGFPYLFLFLFRFFSHSLFLFAFFFSFMVLLISLLPLISFMHFILFILFMLFMSFVFLMPFNYFMLLVFIFFLLDIPFLLLFIFDHNYLALARDVVQHDLHILDEAPVFEVIDNPIFDQVDLEFFGVQLYDSDYVPNITRRASIPFLIEHFLEHPAKLNPESINHPALVVQQYTIIEHKVFIGQCLV